MNKNGRLASIFWRDEGFSTVGMALALLLTLALIFTCAQVYEVQTSSAHVQDVADAAVLASENTVAEFHIVVTLCDALAFTLSLAFVIALGVAAVCACIPSTAALSEAFFKAADQIRSARTSFCEQACESLNDLQQALPFIATVKAQEVMQANSTDGASYQGVVILAPWSGSNLDPLDFEQSDTAWEKANETRQDLSDAGAQAEEAAKKANAFKERAYQHDSGSQSEYCMYERAAKLASLPASSNPYFSSVDTWSFSAALKRVQSYYQVRYQNEAPQGTSVDEKANSALRKRFYAYAKEQVSRGYVHETESSFQASFPLLPKNTSEMRSTSLYTDKVYPITQDAQGHLVMHAWDGCPGLSQGTKVGVGSIQDMDGSPNYVTCTACKFVPSSMGKVAAASSAIENGFEYHYNIVAQMASEYEKERRELDRCSQQVKDLATNIFDTLAAAFDEIKGQRIHCSPPGALGAVALVVNTGQMQTHFASAFVSSSQTLGLRAAVSAATLVSESSDEGKNIITSFLDGVTPESGGAVGAAQVVLQMWSGLLEVYAHGQEALKGALEELFDAIPLTSHSGLGAWASQAFASQMEELGFDPPDLSAKKAVLVNSGHVLEADSSTFSARLLSIKQQAVASGGDGIGINGALSALEAAAQDVVSAMSSEFTVATLVVFDGAIEIPLTITLPAAVSDGLEAVFQQGIDWLRRAVATWTGVRQWR